MQQPYLGNGPESAHQDFAKASARHVPLHNVGFRMQPARPLWFAAGFELGSGFQPLVPFSAKQSVQIVARQHSPRRFRRSVAELRENISIMEAADGYGLGIVDGGKDGPEKRDLTDMPVAHGRAQISTETRSKLSGGIFGHAGLVSRAHKIRKAILSSLKSLSYTAPLSHWLVDSPSFGKKNNPEFILCTPTRRARARARGSSLRFAYFRPGQREFLQHRDLALCGGAAASNGAALRKLGEGEP
jgi:hypothetical protein